MTNRNSGKGFKAAILILIVLVCGFLFIHSSLFNLKTVEITGNYKVSKEEIMAMSGLSVGTNLFSVNKMITARSIEIHPMIKKAVIKRKIFSTLEVQVIERQVWAVIPYQGNYLMVDDEGICIDKLSEVNLGKHTLITMDKYPARVNLGQAVNAPAVQMIRKVWQAIPDIQRNRISEFHYSDKDQSILIYTLKGTEVRFGKLERLDEKVQTFTEIFKIENELQQDGKEVLEYVDIRYKGQPVVKTAK